MGKFWILSLTWYILHKILPFFLFVTSARANLSTGSKKKMFGISYTVVRPKIPSTIINFIGLKGYTVQIRVVHCTIFLWPCCICVVMLYLCRHVIFVVHKKYLLRTCSICSTHVVFVSLCSICVAMLYLYCHFVFV